VGNPLAWLSLGQIRMFFVLRMSSTPEIPFGDVCVGSKETGTRKSLLQRSFRVQFH
jgi:hypothetical protein